MNVLIKSNLCASDLCCSVLQCVEPCCSALQCVAMAPMCFRFDFRDDLEILSTKMQTQRNLILYSLLDQGIKPTFHCIWKSNLHFILYSLLHLECHYFNLKSQSMLQFSRSLLPRSVEKRPVRLALEMKITWHSKYNKRVDFYSRNSQKSACYSRRHCNTLQHTPNTIGCTLRSKLTFIAEILRSQLATLGVIATHCNTLQHTATHCNTLQLIK